MIHILIDGPPHRVRQLAGWLSSWGMSALPLPRAAGHPAAQPRVIADAVVVVWDRDNPDPGIDRLIFCEAAAPLVLVGGDHAPAALRNAAAALVSSPGGQGEHLREALRYCLGREQADSEPPALRDGYEAYLQFFNHEFRTPLTAALMSLQTVERQLEASPECGVASELVDRIRRNLQRLQQTVEWAGDFVKGAVAGCDGHEPVLIADLLEDLDELTSPVPLSWEAELADWTVAVAISREDWRRLLRQVMQAVHYFDPQTHVEARVRESAPPATGIAAQSLVLGLRLEGAAKAGSARVCRTGLTGAGSPADELRRLLGFTISPGLLQAIGARLQVDVADGAPNVRLEIPLALQPLPC